MSPTPAPSTGTGVYARLQSEVNQAPGVRHPLYRSIESRLGDACVVAFFTSFSRPVMIENEDADMLEEVLRNTITPDRRLFLILNSLGGDALAAERIVNVCDAFSDGRFSVIVPKAAKSAATMICLGAKQIMMSSTSELGPVDPQILIRDDQGKPSKYIAAHDVRRSFEELMEKAIVSSGRLEPFLQQLSRYDSREMAWIQSQQALAESIAVKLLKKGVLHSSSEDQIKAQSKPFLVPSETKVHGRPIYHDLARNCGLDIVLYGLDDPMWTDVWDLYIRLKHIVNHPSTGVGKIIESTSGTWTVGVG